MMLRKNDLLALFSGIAFRFAARTWKSYKVSYDFMPLCKMIAFVLSNAGSTQRLSDFAVTVDAVEELTGLDFFALIPEEEQAKLEPTININDWEMTIP